MKILVIGADGFMGRAIAARLRDHHQVYTATRKQPVQPNEFQADLLDKETIKKAIMATKPEVIINSAGIVDATQDVSLNVQFTRNLLEAAKESGLTFKAIIISGSAAEYGIVDSLPVPETAPLRAAVGYALSKVQETTFALEFAKTHNLPVIIARIFNPIGTGMRPKFLIPGLIKQLEEVRQGTRRQLEVSRLDAKRDYIHVNDVAEVVEQLVEKDPQETVYNVGVGRAVSNQELVDLVIRNSGLQQPIKVIETAAEPEPMIASQADIRRLTNEFNWTPSHQLEAVIKEIMHVGR